MKTIRILFLLCFLYGCSSAADYKKQLEVRTLLAQNKLPEALAITQKNDYFSSNASQLIQHMDRGMLHYMNSNYYQALKEFDKAKQLSDELYTRSVTRTAVAGIVGQSFDAYRGEKFELSILRFFQALCHYNLFTLGFYESHRDGDMIVPRKELSDEEKRMHANAVRATVVEWDSLLNSFYADEAGKNKFKTDMLAKVWGGFVHKQFPADQQIARQLYKDIHKVLLQNYDTYPSYNNKYAEYDKNYSKLQKLSKAEIEKTYIQDTDHAKYLKQYADAGEKSVQEKKPDTLAVVLKTGRISLKRQKRVSYTIPIALLLGTANSGNNDFRQFIFTVLPGQVIYFGLPEREKKAPPPTYILIVKDTKGKPVHKEQMALAAPLSDIAYHEYEKNYNALYTATATRVAAKHAAALWTAYLLYKERQKNDDSNALLWARLSYSMATVGIAASEQADLRYWGTLPSNIYMQTLRIPEGEYTLEIERNGVPVYTHEASIAKGKAIYLDLSLLSD